MASSGEGSRGGKVIGHSKSGKAIYDHTAAAAAGLEHNGPHARAAAIDRAGRDAKLPPLRGMVPPGLRVAGSPQLNARVDQRIASKQAWQSTRGMAITGNVSNAAHAKAADAHELAARHADNTGHTDYAKEHRELAAAHRVGASTGASHATKAAVMENIGQSRISMEHARLAEAEKKTAAPLHGNLDRPAVFNKPGYKPR